MSEQALSRVKERRLAAKYLYSLEYMYCHSVKDLEEHFTQYLDTACDGREYSNKAFSWQLVCGVWSKQNEIDAKITQYTHNWKIERIGKIELIALRIALYEILYTPDMPKNVVLKEALAIVQAFGDNSANSFIIGIIDKVAKE